MSGNNTTGVGALIGIGVALYSVYQVWKDALWHEEYMKAIAYTLFIAPLVGAAVGFAAAILLAFIL